MVSLGDDMRYEMLKYENIRNIRIDRGFTQKQIAEYPGISQNTYSQYEIGVLNYPVDAIVKLAVFYGVSTDYLPGCTTGNNLTRPNNQSSDTKWYCLPLFLQTYPNTDAKTPGAVSKCAGCSIYI